MNYTKVSIPKNGDGAGCATPKSSKIIIIDVEDIKAEPTREVGNVSMTGPLTLIEGAKAISFYATSPSIDLTEEYSGEPDARGVKQGVSVEHPGNSIAVKNFTEAFMNKGVIIMVQECDGSAEGRTQYFGSKCNPLYMSIERTDNKDANKRKFTWKQEVVDKFLPGDYTDELPEVAEVATTNKETA